MPSVQHKVIDQVIDRFKLILHNKAENFTFETPNHVKQQGSKTVAQIMNYTD